MIVQLEQIARQYGTPCFVYFMDDVFRRVRELRSVFEDLFEVSYAVKANPNSAILWRLNGRVEMLDVSSAGELERAVLQGWDPQRISFTGPVKRDQDLQSALRNGIGDVVLESVEEARRLDELAASGGRVQPVLVRIAPARLPRGFGVNMAGRPSQFGIDEETADAAIEEITQLPRLRLRGFHVYSGTQCLKADAVAENYEIFLDLFQRFSESHDVVPEKLIFGSGLGIPYHETDAPIDLQAVAKRINPALQAMRSLPRFRQSRLVLETGRYLIGEAGFYLTRIVRIKHSRGTDILLCDGGMNHYLGACGHLGTVLHRNYRMLQLTAPKGVREERPYDLVGPLCTSIDTLGHGVKLPGPVPGDVIAVRCSGAYGLTASPVYFISHEPARELLVEGDGDAPRVTDVSQLQSVRQTQMSSQDVLLGS